MSEEKLMIFLQKILENKSNKKTEYALRQLREILTEQNTSRNLIALVDATIDSIPEAKEIAQHQMINRQQISIAEQRARERKYREWEMNNYRGCR